MTNPAVIGGRRRRVIDCHAHFFPFLGGASGFPTPADHLAYAQWALRRHVQPVRRVRDNAVAETPTLIKGEEIGRGSLTNVGFHAAPFGRFAWTVNGEEYDLQFMPPSLQEMTAPPAFLIALMDYAGIDLAVLQNDGIYGRLNDEFADAVKRWPDRFIALAQVDPDPDPAVAQCDRLRQSVEQHGLHGLFFKIDDFYDRDFSIDPFGEAYQPLWDLVTILQVPVFWHFAGVPVPTVENYLGVWERFAGWLDRYPGVPSVMVGGISLDLLLGSGMPAFMRQAISEHDVLVEILFPIIRGGEWRYPYAECHAVLRMLLDEFGAAKLVWGSDIPNVERHCTYRQSLDYLEACEFIGKSDHDLIVGGNLERIFHLEQ